MGFDLHGIKPKNDSGTYFRNNCWWWRPLWNYICRECSDIITIDIAESGHYNDGKIVDKALAEKISKRLDSLLWKGEVKKWEKEYAEYIKSLPLILCELCKGTGVRNDNILKGKCNGCDGKGKREDIASSYPFSKENVEEFSEFCKNSGGFEIW